MKLYIDTNIFLDYLFERKNLQGKDISKPAQRLFWRAIQCEFFIIYSEHTASELAKRIDLSKTIFLFEILKQKLIPIKISKEDIDEAKKLSKNNFPDALHVILANKSGADCIITRNKKDFAEFSRILDSKLPEDV